MRALTFGPRFNAGHTRCARDVAPLVASVGGVGYLLPVTGQVYVIGCCRARYFPLMCTLARWCVTVMCVRWCVTDATINHQRARPESWTRPLIRGPSDRHQRLNNLHLNVMSPGCHTKCRSYFTFTDDMVSLILSWTRPLIHGPWESTGRDHPRKHARLLCARWLACSVHARHLKLDDGSMFFSQRVHSTLTRITQVGML